EEMYALHKKMDILVLTSRFEGLPLVIMEAMSCGVAIIATAVDGIAEHVKNHESGLLIYTKDEKEIITRGFEHIKLLTENNALREKISAHNHKYALENFSRTKFIESYRNMFHLETPVAHT